MQKNPAKVALGGKSLDDQLAVLLQAHEYDLDLLVDQQNYSKKLETWIKKCAP